VASLSQGRTAAAQCGLFTHKSVPVIFEPPCSNDNNNNNNNIIGTITIITTIKNLILKPEVCMCELNLFIYSRVLLI